MTPATATPNALAPGYRLDRYELLCPIADGGMASVWIARLRGKHGFEKLVAIKTILPKFAEDVRFQQMFLDEARIASRIEHVNVSQILDLGEEHGILYLAMEWVDGDALSRLRQAVERRANHDASSAPPGGRIPPGVVLRVLADTCGGLHAAHELRGSDGHNLGVVHRDVSPQNILVSMRGVAKLIDFGIAKARDRVADETNAGLIKGKIQYMSPEQAMGHDVDRRADVWAVGAILYHLLSGRPPYEGENQLATLHLLTSGQPPRPLAPTIHPEIAAVVRRALAYDPAKRFATADEMQEAIEQAMVEARMTTTTSDVAAFVGEYMADRARGRKQAIDIALEAAKERARVEAILQPSRDSTSGIGVHGAAAQALPASPLPLSRPSTVPPPSRSGIHASTPSIAVAYGGAEATPSSAEIASPPTRRGGLVALAAVLGVALVGAVALIAFLALRPSSAMSASRQTPATAASASSRPAPSAPSAIASAGASSAAPSASSPTAETPSASASAAPPKLLPFPAFRPPVAPSASAPPAPRKIDDGF